MKSNNYTIFSQQFNDISHPWRQKNREPLPTALYPISRYSGARYKGGSLYVDDIYNTRVKYVQDKRETGQSDKADPHSLSCLVLCYNRQYANVAMAERGRGGLEWVVESTTVTHSSADRWDFFTSPGIDTR